MLGQAKQMKQAFEQLQSQLAHKTVQADAGAGAVRVVANGQLEIVSIHLDRPLLAALVGQGPDTDQQMVEDLIAAAVNAALAKARTLVQQEMSRLTGPINIPGIEKMLGQ